MVSENFICILNWLPQGLCDNHIDPLVLISHFIIKGILNTDEEAIIKQHTIPQRQISALCDLLKSKPDECLVEIQQLAFAHQWSEISSMLNKLGLPTFTSNALTNTNFQEKPFCFGLKYREKGFVGRESEMLAIHEIVSKNVGKKTIDRSAYCLVIHGLGGVGKTQLILNYCLKYKDEFDSIIWISAESTNHLTVSLQKLAEQLSMEQQRLSFAALGKVLAKKLAGIGPKRLTIFDNAGCLDAFSTNETNCYKKFPTEFLTDEFFIITSRHIGWKDSTKMHVEALKNDDAIKVVGEILKQNQDFMDGVCELVSTLHCFPLAVKHAAGYIKMKNKFSNEGYSCRKYLSDYQENVKHAKDLINIEPTDMETTISTIVAVYTTWRVTFEKIQSLRYGNNSKLNYLIMKTNEKVPHYKGKNLLSKILNVASFLCAENIHIQMFSKLSSSDAHLSWALNTLEKFSMISIDHGSLNIHKLVQDVTRLNLLRNGVSEKTIHCTNELLINYFPHSFTKKFKIQRNLFPHLLELKTHFNRIGLNTVFPITNNLRLLYKCILETCFNFKDAQTMKIVSEELLSIDERHYGKQDINIVCSLSYLANAHDMLGDPQTQKTLLERELKIKEHHYGEDHIDIAENLVHLGNTYYSLGDPQTQKNLLERALKIKEQHYGYDHFEMANTLIDLGNVCNLLGDPQTQKRYLERALNIKEKHYGNDHFEVAKTLESLELAFDSLGDPKAQKMLLERAISIKEKHYCPEHFEVAKSLLKLRFAYNSLGDPKMQKTVLDRALKIKERHYGSDHLEVAKTLMSLHYAIGSLGDPLAHKALLEKVLKIEEKHYGPDHLEISETLESLAHIVYYKLRDPQTAKTLLVRALKIKEQHYGHDHIEVGKTLVNLGSACNLSGDPQTQKLLLERVLKIYEQYYGPDHFGLVELLESLASVVYYSLGDAQTNKTLLERALTIKEQHYGKDHFEVGDTLINLANACNALGDLETQQELLQRALKIKVEHYGCAHLEVANVLMKLNHVHYSLGNPCAQKELLEKVLLIKEHYYGPNHFEVAKTLAELGYVCNSLGDTKTQLMLLEKVLKIQEKHFGSDHLEVAETLSKLANANFFLGHLPTQKTLLQRVLKIHEQHYGPDHVVVARTRVALGNVCNSLGDVNTHIRALKTQEKHYSCDHLEVSKILTKLANTNIFLIIIVIIIIIYFILCHN